MADATSRNIVLFSDGTGNAGTSWSGSNVWKTFLSVTRHDHEQDTKLGRQIVIYDQGVGTSSLKISKALGGAFGYGLSQNIRELYFDLCRTYRPGDKIFIFGFSRGAFTARSLAGMISDIGVIQGSKVERASALEGLAVDAYKAYRSNRWQSKREELEQKCGRVGSGLLEPDIHFVGVWDSVDAIGVPVDELRDVIYQVARRFLRPHNMHLTNKMKNVYHALAIDDDRNTFSPDVFKEPSAEERQAHGISIEQVWFAGAHSNVGGGYPRNGLSLVALDWMMEKASACGIRFDQDDWDLTRRFSDVHSTLYDPRSGPSAYYRYNPRNIAELCRKAGELKIPGNEQLVSQPLPKIHFTVLDRAKLGTADYAPLNLPVDFEVVCTCHKDWEQETIETFKQALAASAELRREKTPDAWRLIGRRRWLYRLFLVATLLVAALGIALMISPEKTIETYREYSIFNKIWVKFWEARATESPAWLSKAGGWVGKALKTMSPKVLENLVTGLLKLPEAIVAIGLIATALLWMKKRLLAKMRYLGRGIWKRVFAD